MLLPASSLGSVRLSGYQPLVAVAAGGMATLYVARKLGAAGFERLVAIKRVHPHLLLNAEFRDMFRDEARVCSVIRHPNVVSMLDVVDADGELFLVLDYVESLSLSELLHASRDAGRPLEPSVVSRILVDALAGLQAAHEATDLRGVRLDVVHRDVSPQNIIVGIDGTSRLIDFGIAKAALRIHETESGVVKGKLRYMSPEQVRRKPLDRRTDIFSAGIVLFEALTGRRLVGGEDDGDIALAILLGGFAAPSSLVPGLPEAVDAVVAKALARERDDRFQHASEVQEALEAAIPPASPREVGRLVEELGSETLGPRRKALRDALEASPDTIAEPSTPDLQTATTAVAPSRGWTPRSRLLLTALALVAVGGGAALTTRAALSRSGGTTPVRSAEPAPVASTAMTASAPEPSASASASSSAPLPAASSPVTPSASVSGRKASPRVVPPSDLHRKNPYGGH